MPVFSFLWTVALLSGSLQEPGLTSAAAVSPARCDYQYLLRADSVWPVSSQLMTSSSNARCGAAPPDDFEARAGDARFMGRLGCGGWMPDSNDSAEYWQINLVDTRAIAEVTIDGFRHRFTGRLHYVMSATVELSHDGRHFTSPPLSLKSHNSTKAGEYVSYVLLMPTSARYVRLTNFASDDAGGLGMRVLLTVCSSLDSGQETCNAPLGLSSPLRIPDSAFSAGELRPGPDQFVPPHLARLDGSHSAWCFVSLANTFLEVDLGEQHLLSAVRVAGFHAGSAFWSVNQFSLYLDGLPVRQLLPASDREVFTGPQNDSSPLTQTLRRPMRARRVRLRNFGADGVHFNCLRLELYGCPATVPTVTGVPGDPVNSTTTAQRTTSGTGHGRGGLKSALSTEAKFGIAIGVVCPAVIAGTLVVLYLRFRKERHLYACADAGSASRWTEGELSTSSETSSITSDTCVDTL